MPNRRLLLVATVAIALTAGRRAIASTPVGLDMEGMDRSVRPGDDFYAFANGTWQRAATIPPDRAWTGAPITMQDRTAADIRSIIQNAASRLGSRMGDLYASYIDQTTITAHGLAKLRPWLNQVAAAADHSRLAAVMGRLAPYDVGGLFAIGIGEDDKAPGAMVVTIKQGGLVLPGRDLYLAGGGASVRLTAYRSYLERILTLSGVDTALDRADAIIAFETALAQVHRAPSDARNADASYNAYTVTDLEREARGFDWRSWLGAMKLDGRPRYIVAQPDALAGEAAVWARTPIRVLQDYLRVRVLTTYARYLPPAFADARFALFGTALAGTAEQPPRWRQGVSLVTNLLGDDVGRAYVAAHLTPEARGQAARLVKNIVAALDAKLAAAAWMTPTTRIRARAKLARTRLKIGYPDRWPAGAQVPIARDDLIGNVARLNAARFADLVARLDRPIDRDAWVAPVTVPNAFASAGANEIILPAAILQPPLFDPKADAAVNYARIGATVAHELCHLFDDQGRKYDEHGALRDWWTQADVEAFQQRERALIAQASSYEPLKDVPVNGALTIGENIADLAGLEVAYAAFRNLPASARPMLDGMTADQRFFIAWAQAWRSAYREPFLRTLLQSDAHAPGRERALTVRNMDAWYAAFGSAADGRLFLPEHERVRFW